MADLIVVSEAVNREAYDDVLECKHPSRSHDPEYMQAFNFWRPMQKYPGDDEMMLLDDL